MVWDHQSGWPVHAPAYDVQRSVVCSSDCARDLANWLPTSSEPINPGDCVKAMASISARVVLAFLLMQHPQPVRYAACVHGWPVQAPLSILFMNGLVRNKIGKDFTINTDSR